MTKQNKGVKQAVKKKPMTNMIKVIEALAIDLGYPTNSVDLARKNR